ncbi:hypothetical protein FNF29_06239 [Cafeteria roenbergensis]|uniref:Uncharacterized protein n=1 Tax=Cafeteria roenbergensis TaxID=33653 RepID=A0A5A8CBI7_CAFRO|nr:hypothetical protein FNF29_06239 [Cafeteria roenbergensis]|eukprot:KAA0149151.1 hypothetical protein FNF29_06239 [Cafeteria roenbergensis]
MASLCHTYALASAAVPLEDQPVPQPQSEADLDSSGTAAGSADFDDALVSLVIGEEETLSLRSTREADTIKP